MTKIITYIKNKIHNLDIIKVGFVLIIMYIVMYSIIIINYITISFVMSQLWLILGIGAIIGALNLCNELQKC